VRDPRVQRGEDRPPHITSVVKSVVAAFINIPSVQALVSLAILVYYGRHHCDEAPARYEQAGRLINEGL
jgi:hypothetical protein